MLLSAQIQQILPEAVADALPQPRLKVAGDSGLLVELGDRIDPETHARVLQLDDALTRGRPRGVIEQIVGYTSLLVIVDPVEVDVPALSAFIREEAAKPLGPRPGARRWRVPVVYGGAFGFDLDFVAAHTGMPAADVVSTHVGGRYSVAMFGFLPGFAYLSGLPGALTTPRRATPRASVPAGSIAIGGAQTAIGSIEGPCGWHVIGRAPIRTFDPARYPATIFAPGDEIEFISIGASEFESLASRAADGEMLVERIA